MSCAPCKQRAALIALGIGGAAMGRSGHSLVVVAIGIMFLYAIVHPWLEVDDAQ